MDQKQIEEQAIAIAAAGFHVGHIFAKCVDGTLQLKCMKCGHVEIIAGYSDGAQPKTFIYQPIRMDSREYVKCEKCRTVHDRIVPYAQ